MIDGNMESSQEAGGVKLGKVAIIFIQDVLDHWTLSSPGFDRLDGWTAGKDKRCNSLLGVLRRGRRTKACSDLSYWTEDRQVES